MSQSVAQRDTSRRQTAEETARDRLRATLLAGTPERESAPDVAGRAKQHFPESRMATRGTDVLRGPDLEDDAASTVRPPRAHHTNIPPSRSN